MMMKLHNAIVLGLISFIVIFLFSLSNQTIRIGTSLPPMTKPSPAPLAIVTIDEVFAKNNTHNIQLLPKERVRVLIATGDIIPARAVNYQTSVRYKDYTWPYQKTHELLTSGDITFVNLETPLLLQCPVTQVGMVFCGDAKNVQGLVFSGVDVVSLANNHAGNHGEKGVQETEDILLRNNIVVTGTNAHPITIVDVRGVKFAFLGYDDITLPQPGVRNADEAVIKSDIAMARNQADIVIVTFHWGAEYQSQPDDRQKYLAHYTIDTGADLIIGNHPHWVQPIEFYKGKLITYAHGNFVFDQMWSQETREGVVGKYTFYDKTLVDVEYFPVQIDDYGQPHFVEGEQKKSMLENMKKESLLLSAS